MKNLIIITCTSLLMIINVQCGNMNDAIQWQINDLEYLETTGFNVLVFHNYYPVGKQGGIEFIHHDDRIASNGYINVDLPPGQSFPRPETAERKVDRENKIVEAKVTTEGFDRVQHSNMAGQ